jgi:hypothetical protein
MMEEESNPSHDAKGGNWGKKGKTNQFEDLQK